MKALDQVRNRIYVFLFNLAGRVAPENTREIHNEVLNRGLAATHEALNARLAAHSDNPR